MRTSSFLIPSLAVLLLAAASSVATAQGAPTKAPAADPAAPPVVPAGQEATMVEDPPPQDIEGTNETPESPVTDQPVAATTMMSKATGYPTEYVARPITLTRGMSEVQLGARATLSPFISNLMLRARYGINSQWQIGLRYNAGGFYKDPVTGGNAFNVGKAAGLDVVFQIKPWIGASISVPIYLDPVATSVNIGVPLNFRFGEKVLVGGLGDLLEIRAKRFVPSYTSEFENEARAQDNKINTTLSKGRIRFAGFGAYQHKPNLAAVGQFGFALEDFSSNDQRYFIRAGGVWTPKRYLDLTGSLGFDDLAAPGKTFGLELALSVRI